MSLVSISRQLADAVDRLSFPEPVACVYNPLQYARQSHERFLDYGKPGVPNLLLGMNPGPWGMAQTGVPFGEITAARDWLQVEAPVKPPRRQHPKRPIEGFNCTRSEVSGRRLWGWAQKNFSSPRDFFHRFFILNYCPLVFMEESGKNLTPDKLPADIRAELFELCDTALQQTVDYLQPKQMIGVGQFALKRAKIALPNHSLLFGSILHPSPASPAANRGWEEQVEKQLAELGVMKP
ncbi:MAG: single-stranded DNA-binding protein [Planctomycetota bacterium]|nr:single-stranded DNA-binding protein [Planctomycetota bacterium]